MIQPPTIITIGLAPCWDITCRVDGIDWGQHKQVSSVSNVPAGKSMNVSRALAWMEQPSIAAGLWGEDDFAQLAAHANEFIDSRLTAVPGRTRHNINIIDSKNTREMHLRSPSHLATQDNMARLRRNLKRFVTAQSICVFSGSMPDGDLLPEVLDTIQLCRWTGAKIVLDTNGAALKALVANQNYYLLKPNIEELSHLIGAPLKDDARAIIAAARTLLGSAQMVLVSRGAKGAILVTKDTILQSRCLQTKKAHSTVACGDFLVAGFLASLQKEQSLAAALSTAMQCATARAWSLDSQTTFKDAAGQIEIQITEK